METGVVAVAIVAVVEALQDAVPTISGNQTRVLAAVLGGVAGWFGLFGLSVETGLVAGLFAVGGHSLVTKMRGK